MSLPEKLGRLRRVERIGAGGFATVWLYHDDELDSPVAVKALADNWAQRLDIRERFLEEARILRRADSDHVVRVYDIGEADGTPYFVMSYADRGTVANLLDDEPDLPMVLDLVDQAAAGLEVLHRRGVIHRDIKPQNLLLSSDGRGGLRLMVADLGMAKAELQASGLTQVVGTPAYMAPEQATMSGLSTRADTYALAAVAYRLLTGHTIRSGGLADVIDGRVPPAPSELGEASPAVDAVFARALNNDPALRHDSPGDFTRTLRTAYDPEMAGSVPHRRRSVPPLLLVTMVFAVCFAAAYFLAGALR